MADSSAAKVIVACSDDRDSVGMTTSGGVGLAASRTDSCSGHRPCQ
jgi:hypothetical protein